MESKQLCGVVRVMGKAAIKAGDLLLRRQANAKLVDVERFVTDMDLFSEEVLFPALGEFDPTIPIYSEESGGEARRRGLLWVIDPINGTKNYFRQDDLWSVSIALVEDGCPIAGAIYAPSKGFLFHVTNNDFSCMSSGDLMRTIRVSEENDFANCQFALDWGRGNHDEAYAMIGRLSRCSKEPLIRGCCTLGMMYVAMGRIPGYVFHAPTPFDHAAAGLIVQKAGGVVTELDGSPWSPFSTTVVATNGVVHDRLLQVLRH